MVKTEQLSSFEFVLDLGSKILLQAGKTPQEAARGDYATRPAAPRELFEEYLPKLAASIHKQSSTIDVAVETVGKNNWIVSAGPSSAGPSADSSLASVPTLGTDKKLGKKKLRASSSTGRFVKKAKKKSPKKAKRKRKGGGRR